MRMTQGMIAIGIAMLVASVSCTSEPAAPPPPPFKTDSMGVQRLMRLVLEPAADTFWMSVSTTVTEKGVDEKFPQNDEEWEAVRHGAAVLVESGNLLMMSPRAKDAGDWIKMSAALSDAATTALRAAEVKDVDGVFKTGGDVYQACTNCHQKYWIDDPRAR